MSATSSEVTLVVRDPTFYFTDVIFLVEDSLFRVPRRPFEEGSDVFSQMFREGSVTEGSKDSHHPIHLELESVSKLDFKNFLSALFPAPRFEEATLEEWISVLKLSTQWEFDALRQKAIENLSYMEIGCTEKAAFAVEYKVEQWLLPALNDLARRRAPIGVDDVKLLGLPLALRMAAIRESITSSRQVGQRDARDIDFTSKIRSSVSFVRARRS